MVNDSTCWFLHRVLTKRRLRWSPRLLAICNVPPGPWYAIINFQNKFCSDHALDFQTGEEMDRPRLAPCFVSKAHRRFQRNCACKDAGTQVEHKWWLDSRLGQGLPAWHAMRSMNMNTTIGGGEFSTASSDIVNYDSPSLDADASSVAPKQHALPGLQAHGKSPPSVVTSLLASSGLLLSFFVSCSILRRHWCTPDACGGSNVRNTTRRPHSNLR